MTKTNKLAEGVYATADGKFRIVADGEGFVVNERRDSQWVTVETAKTKADAERKLAKLTKTEDEAPELTTEEVVENLSPEE